MPSMSGHGVRLTSGTPVAARMRQEDGDSVMVGAGAIVGAIERLAPKRARDWSYDLVAKHRYLIVGKRDDWGIPEKGLRKRMRE